MLFGEDSVQALLKPFGKMSVCELDHHHHHHAIQALLKTRILQASLVGHLIPVWKRLEGGRKRPSLSQAGLIWGASFQNNRLNSNRGLLDLPSEDLHLPLRHV